VRSRLALVLLALLAFLVGAPAAYADRCDALRGQLRSVGGGGSEAAQLRRQIAAIRGIERQRACGKRGSGGFFDACGDLAGRRRAAEQQLSQLSGGDGRVTRIRAQLAALGCGGREQRVAKRRDDGAREARSSGPVYSGANALMFCVRLSDGYYFPAPNSQFVGDSAYEKTLDQCRFICDDAEMDVYKLSSFSQESDDMVAVSARKAYRDLPTAFKYRESAEFRACDITRYSRAVNEARARTVTPKNMDVPIIPLPKPRPEYDEPVDVTTTAGTATEALREMTNDKRVRVVGPAFFPEEAE
jgi:hypothetical protein